MSSTLKNILRWGEDQLKSSNIDSSHLDAQILLKEILTVDDAYILSNPKQELSSKDIASYKSLISRRVSNEPIAYILGKKEFWKYTFEVNPHTLIPRPETEFLVEKAFEYISTRKDEKQQLLDIGTGSGIIPISIVADAPNLTAVAIDISKPALETAEKNAQTCGVSERITFFEEDIMSKELSLLENQPHFDIILSNPPYIRSSDIEGLMPEVAEYEPQTALDGGEDGLDFYREIIDKSKKMLANQGLIAFEIGHGQACDLKKIFDKAGIFNNFEVIKDFAGIERVVAATRQG